MKIPVSAIPKYKGKETTHSDMADNVDIRRAIFGAVPEAISQTKDFAKHFGRNSQRESCKLIFDFLKNKLNYVADGDTQVIKLPSALLHTKKGDCKSYSVLTSAILTNLGIPHHFVLVSYNNDPTPSHIYVQTDDGCIIDAVWGKFNDEKKPTYRYEVKPNGQMKVKSISGVSKCGTYMGGCGCGCERCGVNGLGGKLKQAGNFLKDKAKETGQYIKKTAQEFKEDIKDTGKDILDAGKKYGLSAGRGIFLTLVKSNLDGFGSKLGKMNFANLSKQWSAIGGNPTALQDAIKGGSQKPSKVIGLLGKLAAASKTKVKGVTGFNVDALKVAIPTATTAVGTAIAPAAGTAAGASLGAVMVALLPVILDLLSAMTPAEGTTTPPPFPPIPEGDKYGDDGGSDVVDNNVTDESIKEELKKIPQTYDGLKPFFDTSSELAIDDATLKRIYPFLGENGKTAWKQLQKEFNRPSGSTSGGSNTTTYLLIGGAAIAAYFLLKKK